MTNKAHVKGPAFVGPPDAEPGDEGMVNPAASLPWRMGGVAFTAARAQGRAPLRGWSEAAVRTGSMGIIRQRPRQPARRRVQHVALYRTS